MIIDGKSYTVLENLGWQPSAGAHVRIVRTMQGAKVVMKKAGEAWRFRTEKDVLQPPSRLVGMSRQEWQGERARGP